MDSEKGKALGHDQVINYQIPASKTLKPGW
jgi:hypothetical protein